MNVHEQSCWLECLQRMTGVLLFGGLTTGVVVGQAGPVWLQGDGVPGVDRSVFSLHIWDRDGAGPATPSLVMGGRITMAGTVAASGIASLDLATGAWENLGGGVGTQWNNTQQPWVWCCATLVTGELLAGGNFRTAGGVSASGIARWNGAAWAPLGSGTDNEVYAILELPSGEVIAGGAFVTAGGTTVNRIARWDGAAWWPLGTGMNGPVEALARLPNGDVVAGGKFTTAGGIATGNLARWDGQAWWPLGAGAPTVGGGVSALAVTASGELIVGGAFPSFVARWAPQFGWLPLVDPASGTPGLMGTTGNDGVWTIAILPNGDIALGGHFMVRGERNFAVWNGTAWTSLGATNDHVMALAVGTGPELYVGGWFTLAGDEGVGRLAVWNGNWSAIARGFNGTVQCIDDGVGGDVVVGGQFTRAGDANAHYIARWDGVEWHALGGGDAGLNGFVYAVTTAPNGDVIAGGSFTKAGAQNANSIARWDGGAWWPMGSGMDSWVYALEALPNGDIVAGGPFTKADGVTVNQIARWDGVQWHAMAGGGDGGTVMELKTLRTGDLIAAGGFNVMGGVTVHQIARWNGSSWLPLGPGMSAFGVALAYSLTEMPDGRLAIVVGTLIGPNPGGSIGLWDGAAWTSIIPPWQGARTLTSVANGDIVVGFDLPFTSPAAPGFLGRFDGSNWSTIDSGLNWPVISTYSAANGDLFVGGAFLSAGGRPSAHIAIARDVAASASPFGSGCMSSVGKHVLSATVLPMEGGIYESRTTSMPGNSLALSILGFSQVVTPLASLATQGIPGCDLLAWVDRVDLGVPAAGIATFTIAVVATPSLIGIPVYHQVLAAEFGSLGDLIALSSSNGLVLRVGRF